MRRVRRMADAAIQAQGLRKSFGDVQALDGIDLSAPPGTILGLLGPNGAGKTTAVRILTTLLPPDEGSARVAGLDVMRDAAALRSQIGLAGQYAAVDENLTGFENLEMVGRLYHLGRGPARERSRELLERFSLTDAADRLAKTYSGGVRLEVTLESYDYEDAAIETLAPLADERPKCEHGILVMPLHRGTGGIAEAVRRLDAANVDIADIAVRRPTLDDVFIVLTGHAAEEAEDEREEA